MAERVKPIAVRNLLGQVAQELGRAIVTGEIAPGERLPKEEALSRQLGVSRTALREGMKILAAKGLIESRQKTGTRVRPVADWNQLDADVLAWRCIALPTRDFVSKLAEMREVIEPAAAAAAARRRTADQLARIEAAYGAMAAAGDRDGWAEADLAFHQGVLHATNNELMVSLFAVIETALDAYFRLSAGSSRHFNYSLPYHQAVLGAIRDRHPEIARRAMAKTVADSRRNILRHAREA